MFTDDIITNFLQWQQTRPNTPSRLPFFKLKLRLPVKACLWYVVITLVIFLDLSVIIVKEAMIMRRCYTLRGFVRLSSLLSISLRFRLLLCYEIACLQRRCYCQEDDFDCFHALNAWSFVFKSLTIISSHKLILFGLLKFVILSSFFFHR